MKYIFRGVIVFEYIPEQKQIIQHNIHTNGMAAFNYCHFIPEDYKLISEFFSITYKHIQGEEVDLSNINVY